WGQGQREKAPAEYEYAGRSTRGLLTYARLPRCAGVRPRIRRVCRVTGSLSCLRRTPAGMSLGTTVSHAGRSPMKPQVPAAFAAFVGLDWADAQHASCLHVAGAPRRALLRLAHRPE